MSLQAFPQVLRLPLPGGSEGAAVTVQPLVTGYVLVPPDYCVRRAGQLWKPRGLGIGVPKKKWQWLPVPAFLIEHPTAGHTLVDTGFHPSVGVDPAKNLGRLAARFLRCRCETADSVPKRLEALGLSTSSIQVVIMTHLHLDHASCISEFPTATFVLGEGEWAAATAPRPLLRGYNTHHFEHAFDYREVRYRGLTVGSYSSFGRSVDLFGDGSIRLCFTPGHTPGHQSAIARTSQREILMLGDASFVARNYRDLVLPTIAVDDHRYGVSLHEIQLYSRQNPEALIIPSHDVDLWRDIESAQAL